MKKPKVNEHTLAKDLRELCQDAYHEQQSHHPKAALAFAALGKVVPAIATANPGWGHNLHALSRSAIKVH